MSDKVSLELNASYISKAVTAFINLKVQRLADVKRYDARTQGVVQQILRVKAEDTFLWVSLVCKELEGVPLFRTEEVLRELPPRLDPLYDRMLDQLSTQNDPSTSKYCKDVLRSTTLALRPLRLEEVAVTAGLPGDRFTSVDRVSDLISRCGSFLTTHHDVVSFIHLSAKDYFTSGKGRQIFDDSLIKEKGRVAYRLLDALSNTLYRDMYNMRKPGARFQEAAFLIKGSVLPPITYACEYWIEHFSTCYPESDNVLLDTVKVHRFFQKHLLHWVEAMSLLNKISDAIAAIQKLQTVVIVSS